MTGEGRREPRSQPQRGTDERDPGSLGCEANLQISLCHVEESDFLRRLLPMKRRRQRGQEGGGNGGFQGRTWAWLWEVLGS